MEKKNYDIFISFKATYNGVPTEDAKIGLELQRKFKEKNLEVFFSNETLRNESADEYIVAISNAVETAKIFILVATKPEFPRTKWVQKEWTAFLNKKLSNENEDFKFFTVLDNFQAKELPGLINDVQSFNYSQGTDDIVNFILNKEVGSNYTLLDFLHLYYEQEHNNIEKLQKIYNYLIDLNDDIFYQRSLHYMLGATMMRKGIEEGYDYLEKAYQLKSIRAAHFLYEKKRNLEYRKKGYEYYIERFQNKEHEKKDVLIICDSQNKMIDLGIKSAASLYYHLQLFNLGVSFSNYDSDILSNIKEFDKIILIFSFQPIMKKFTFNSHFNDLLEKKDDVTIVVSGIKTHEIPKEYKPFGNVCDAEKRHAIYWLANKIVDSYGE